MKIYITRHGESQWNSLKRTQGSKNTTLTKKGLSQANALAKRLSEERISEIFTSDLDRAFVTADIVGKRLGHRPKDIKELREICLGSWEGMTRVEINKVFPNQLDYWHNDCSFKPENGESILEVKNRVNKFINSLINQSHGKRILLVSHAIICKILITELLNIPTEYLWCFKVDNTSVSIIDVDEPRRTALCINDTSHIL